MNRLIISIVILLVMAAGSALAVMQVNSVTDSLLSQVEKAEDAFMRGAHDECVAAADEMNTLWHDFMSTCILVNDLGHAVEITSSIVEIGSFAREDNDELYTACDRAEAQITLFRDMQTPTFWKIL